MAGASADDASAQGAEGVEGLAPADAPVGEGACRGVHARDKDDPEGEGCEGGVEGLPAERAGAEKPGQDRGEVREDAGGRGEPQPRALREGEERDRGEGRGEGEQRAERDGAGAQQREVLRREGVLAEHADEGAGGAGPFDLDVGVRGREARSRAGLSREEPEFHVVDDLEAEGLVSSEGAVEGGVDHVEGADAHVAGGQVSVEEEARTPSSAVPASSVARPGSVVEACDGARQRCARQAFATRRRGRRRCR